MRIISIFAMIVSLLCVSCKTEYIEVPIDKVRTEYKTITKYDSIYNRDSIYIKEKGDSIIIEKYKYVYNIAVKRDTVSKIDTITTVKTIVKEKEVNKLYTWQLILMVVGGAGLVFSVYRIIRLIK